jgi:hypothetical protein
VNGDVFPQVNDDVVTTKTVYKLYVNRKSQFPQNLGANLTP